MIHLWLLSPPTTWEGGTGTIRELEWLAQTCHVKVALQTTAPGFLIPSQVLHTVPRSKISKQPMSFLAAVSDCLIILLQKDWGKGLPGMEGASPAISKSCYTNTSLWKLQEGKWCWREWTKVSSCIYSSPNSCCKERVTLPKPRNTPWQPLTSSVQVWVQVELAFNCIYTELSYTRLLTPQAATRNSAQRYLTSLQSWPSWAQKIPELMPSLLIFGGNPATAKHKDKQQQMPNNNNMQITLGNWSWSH